MKVAVIGSRGLKVARLEEYLPQGTGEIISGGAVGVDSSAAAFAKKRGIPLTEILPDYEKWGRRAPIVRNIDIVDAADVVLAFWDGSSRGTEFVINYCRRQGKKVLVYMPDTAEKGRFVLQVQAEQLSFNM